MWLPTRRQAARAAAVGALLALVSAIVHHLLALRASNSTAHLRLSVAGRLGNQIIRNVLCSVLARKHNLRFTYSSLREMQALGLDPFVDGTQSHYFAPVMDLTERNYFGLLQASTLRSNVRPVGFFQTPDLARFLRRHLQQPDVQAQIARANARYRHRYRNNTDVFVHVRLGDAADAAPPLAYFERALAAVGRYTRGYIASDDLRHPICRRLAENHHLTPLVDAGPVETLQWASTCRSLVLSAGTFSWLMGALAFHAEHVYHPNTSTLPAWHGDIYVFDDWTRIDY